jgi:hypothetical protein
MDDTCVQWHIRANSLSNHARGTSTRSTLRLGRYLYLGATQSDAPHPSVGQRCCIRGPHGQRRVGDRHFRGRGRIPRPIEGRPRPRGWIE